MNCGHPLKVRSAYTWLLVMLVLSTFAVVAVGLYRMLPLIMDSTFSTAPDSGVSKQDTDGSFGASSLPSSAEKYTQLPLDGRQPTKRELSGAAQKLDAAAVPYWNHVYKSDRIYYYPTDHVLNIDYLVREEFQEVNKTMLHATHRNTYCNATAYSIFRYAGVSARWSFRSDKDRELMYSFRIVGC